MPVLIANVFVVESFTSKIQETPTLLVISLIPVQKNKNNICVGKIQKCKIIETTNLVDFVLMKRLQSQGKEQLLT